MRAACPKEQDAEQWLRMAAALRAFYHEHQLYSQALPLDQERHRRHPSAESTVLLAETQLALGMYSGVVELLGDLTEAQASPRTSVLRGLAFARQGQIDQARKIAQRPGEVADHAGPRLFYDLARLRALVGDTKQALGALTRSFELTPPSQLEAFKARVRECDDFSACRDSADFTKALETRSGIKESNCSQGAGCGNCPMRARCGTKSPKSDAKGP